MQRIVWIGVLILGAAFIWWNWFAPPDPSKMYVFANVSGPSAPTLMAPPHLAKIADYDRGSAHRLAILVTDDTSGWLGLVRAFHSHGVPITVTTDPARALMHKVILVYPIISGRAVKPDVLRGLAAHVRDGGTVLAFNLAGGGLEDLFGVGTGVESRTRTTVKWTKPAAVPEENDIPVSKAGEAQMGSVGYTAATAETVATFDDGAAAITCRTVGGRACVMGVDLGALAERAMNGRAESFGRSYVNAYEPAVDTLIDWVRDLYVAGEPLAWLTSTVPAGKEVSIVLTHDVDFTRSVTNSQAYADALDGLGVKATFFVQTKYVKDFNDDIFFNDTELPSLKGLAARGMEIESHTVAHARTFKSFALGNGKERYPRYMPFVQDLTKTKGGTVLGELRVSRYLLETLVGTPVRAFRPGYLAYPFALPQALQATGYAYSSSITANSTLTHFPFQLTDDRADGALTSIYEFPVTIEDEAPPALPERLPAAQELIGKIAAHHGLVVMLIHPDVTDPKLAFEQAIVTAWRDRAWIGPITAFGDWWRGRDQADVDINERDGRLVLTAGGGAAVQDLDVVMPNRGSIIHVTRAANQRSAEDIP